MVSSGPGTTAAVNSVCLGQGGGWRECSSEESLEPGSMMREMETLVEYRAVLTLPSGAGSRILADGSCLTGGLPCGVGRPLLRHLGHPALSLKQGRAPSILVQAWAVVELSAAIQPTQRTKYKYKWVRSTPNLQVCPQPSRRKEKK